MAERSELIRERNKAHLEATILRVNAERIAVAVASGGVFPMEGWRGFTSTLPNFVQAMVSLAEAQGINKAELLPVRTGLEDKLPQMNIQALNDHVDRIAREKG